VDTRGEKSITISTATGNGKEKKNTGRWADSLSTNKNREKKRGEEEEILQKEGKTESYSVFSLTGREK